MKRFLNVFFVLLCFALPCIAQEDKYETAKPLTDVEILRRDVTMNIEGKYYYGVTVTMQSYSPDYFISSKYRVKVTVEDSKGKKIWKKTLNNAYLYVFRSGQIQVGRPNFTQIIIYQPSSTGRIYGDIREKEGVY